VAIALATVPHQLFWGRGSICAVDTQDGQDGQPLPLQHIKFDLLLLLLMLVAVAGFMCAICGYKFQIHERLRLARSMRQIAAATIGAAATPTAATPPAVTEFSF